MSQPLPASEVVRLAEADLKKAASLRAEAARLVATAEAEEAAALSRAVSVLGPVHGRTAFDLATLSVAPSPVPQRQESAPVGAVAPSSPAVPPSREPSPVASAPGPQVRKTPTGSSVPATVPGSEPTHLPVRPEMYGVDFPSHRREEADDVVARATAAAQRGHKGNPFGNDRGKNAWRKALFLAAFSAQSVPREPLPPVTAAAPGPLYDVSEMDDLDDEEGIAGDGAVSPPAASESHTVETLDADFVQEAIEASVSTDCVEIADPLLDEGGHPEDESLQTDSGETVIADRATHVDVPGEHASDEDEVEVVEIGHDPLEDLDDEVPAGPVSRMVPPRGYPSASVPPPAPAAPSRPAAVPRPALPPRVPPVRLDMHVPAPIPPGRRPGNGMTVQQGPAGLSGVAKTASHPPAVSPSPAHKAPPPRPAFLSRG